MSFYFRFMKMNFHVSAFEFLLRVDVERIHNSYFEAACEMSISFCGTRGKAVQGGFDSLMAARKFMLEKSSNAAREH